MYRIIYSEAALRIIVSCDYSQCFFPQKKIERKTTRVKKILKKKKKKDFEDPGFLWPEFQGSAL